MKYWITILFLINICLAPEGVYIDSSKVRNPRLAWKLSLIPGLGQLYNGKLLKAMGFLGGEYFAVRGFIKFRDAQHIGLRNTYAWWVFGLFVWNIMDAYVDAQMSTFPVKRLESHYKPDSLRVKIE